MSADSQTARDAEARLAALGIAARVEGAGSDGEVAVIRPGREALEPLLEELRDAAVEACRAAGFRFVALELY
jgi:hypothetical protein